MKILKERSQIHCVKLGLYIVQHVGGGKLDKPRDTLNQKELGPFRDRVRDTLHCLLLLKD